MLKELEPIADKLRESHRILGRTLDAMTEEQAAHIKVTPEWAIKDVVAHLAGSEKGLVDIARRMADSQDPQLPPDFSNDANNARMVAKRKDETLAQVRGELDAIHAGLLSLLESITLRQLTLMGQHPLAGEVTLKDLLVIIYSHEMSHGNEISNQFRESKK
jgi:hypothetical protein